MNASRPLAVVTGASTGIGFELARQCATNGFDLLIAADEAAIHEPASQLRAEGAAVDALEANLATTEGVDRLLAEEVNPDIERRNTMTPTIFRLLGGTALVLAALTVGPAMAADPPAKQAAAPAMAPPSTSTFLTNTVTANLFEIESSKVALTKTRNDKVKGFANRMVTDHTNAGTKFKQAVTDAKLTPPAEKLDAKHQALLDDLKKKDGTAFDAAYIKAQHDGHVETVAMFEAYAKGGDNARLKQFANDMLPTLKTHLDQVSKLK